MKHPRSHHLHIRPHFINWVGVSTALLVLLIINTVYITSKIKSDYPTPATRIIGNSNKILTSLQLDETDAYTVSVKNVTEDAKFDRAFTIDPTHTMLIMDISIVNRTPINQDLIPVNQLYVRDREGDTYPLHPSSLITHPLATGTVASGQTATGQIAFDVPKSLAHPLLYIDLGWESLAPTVIDVLK